MIERGNRAAVPASVHAAMEGSVSCGNCGALLHGRFCHECGQQATEEPDSLRAFILTSLSEVINFRSKTLRSLIDLVIRPGELTAAYFRGQRVRFTLPVQLYLIAAAVFFLANSFRPFVMITEDNRIASSLGGLMVGQRLSEQQLEELEAGGVPIEVFRERFQSAVSQSLAPFMIGSILAFALTLGLFNPKRPALMHVVFSLNWTGFYLFVMSLDRLVPNLPGKTSSIAPVLVIGTLIHLVFALRRAYGHGWPRAVASAFGLIVIFNLILAGWIVVVVEYAHRQAV